MTDGLLSCPFCGVKFVTEADLKEHLSKACKKISNYAKIPVELIRVPELRVMSEFESDEDATAFHNSIENYDIIEPVVVVLDENFDFWLADGLHRVEVAKALGEKWVEAKVIKGSKADAILLSLIANKQRGRINPYHEVLVIRHLIDDEGYSQNKLAMLTGLSQPYISMLYSIGKGNSQILERLRRGEIGIREAYRLNVQADHIGNIIDNQYLSPLEPSIPLPEGAKRLTMDAIEKFKEKRIPVLGGKDRGVGEFEEKSQYRVCQICKEDVYWKGTRPLYFCNPKHYDLVIRLINYAKKHGLLMKNESDEWILHAE